VALGTIHRGVLALQRELSLRMIEALVDRLQRNLFPPARTVAGLAALREAPVMRVFVAIGALAKRNAHVLRLAVWSIRMALGALHLGMQAGQGIARLRMIKLGLTALADIDRFPIHKIVALQAVRSQAAFVLILVTRDASCRETKICPGRVLDFDGRAFLGGDVARIVAFVTGQAFVFAFKHVPRFFMIEGFDVPLDQREVHAVVIGVAAGALLAGARRDVVGGVQTFVGREPDRNLGVTFHTLQLGLATELVALGAVCRTVQEFVRTREGAGRNLRGGHGPQPK